MRVQLLKTAYVGDRLYTVPTRTVKGADVFVPIEVDIPDEGAKALVEAGTARPVAPAVRNAASDAPSRARKAVAPAPAKPVVETPTEPFAPEA
ncbi:hypothetical protein [Paludisphaera sp.]|uniref:hypothetical protein n=1 Tax=Paludisphaera sp. TaxID=2017432 RepID=UPI00301DAE93